MDVQARLKPIKPWPALAVSLERWDPPDRPKYFRVLCGNTFATANGPHVCPQEFGTITPLGLFGGRVSRATKLRALDGLPPAKPSDWLLDHDGYYDRDEDGAYRVIPRRERAPRPGWRHSGNEYYPGGRRRLPEPVQQAIAWRDMDKQLADHPELRFVTVGHKVLLPAVIICPRCGTRNCAEPPYDLEPYWRKKAAELRPLRPAQEAANRYILQQYVRSLRRAVP